MAPKTVDHIFKLVRLGCYNTNHFFRVFAVKVEIFCGLAILDEFMFSVESLMVREEMYWDCDLSG